MSKHWKSCSCPDCERKRDARRFRIFLCLVIALTAVAAWLCGCSSPAPAATPEFNVPSKAEQIGPVLTQAQRDRFNGLIGLYGQLLNPPLAIDDGITRRADGDFDITGEALAKFAAMDQWHRMQRDSSTK